ncbi:uncharacterized protein A1O9_13094 [Exophiala aquamarina CBS 119918]|uniref:Uncharacterized protein n=1 Tax=Exophiala aquamarina CBS 119918 TaxID=1182545 RepID=A0A072NU20_9EURO|nr:uncharacterized protein A1O9_13094 [Exophiala aquamarina CBS 119918]KEF50857.1 hypothetical protein A1O9_13094 [Exophiala aquamarina CBS 119918]
MNLKATKVARCNALGLAKGHRDLAILTQEPADYEDVMDHTELGGLPPTIEFLSRQLLEASGTRNWENTCIVDMRSFRSSRLRNSDILDSVRAENDSLSYDATEEMVEILQPDVLVVCQTATASVLHGFARRMSSSIQASGRISLHKLRNVKQVLVVNGLHPMYALKFAEGLGPEVAQLRQAIIRFNILQAVNLLAGRVIVGNGEYKLRDAVWAASRNPPCLLSSGRLDPHLDDRFKGVFLADNATPEMKQLWAEAAEKKSDEERTAYTRFVSIVQRLRNNANETVEDATFTSLQGLREALPLSD